MSTKKEKVSLASLKSIQVNGSETSKTRDTHGQLKGKGKLIYTIYLYNGMAVELINFRVTTKLSGFSTLQVMT